VSKHLLGSAQLDADVANRLHRRLDPLADAGGPVAKKFRLVGRERRVVEGGAPDLGDRRDRHGRSRHRYFQPVVVIRVGQPIQRDGQLGRAQAGSSPSVAVGDLPAGQCLGQDWR
jgi:hypothetical protein